MMLYVPGCMLFYAVNFENILREHVDIYVMLASHV